MGTHPIFESDFDCLTENEMAKGVKRQQGFTAAEEQLLAGFSRTTSGKGTAVFWIHALYVAAIPIWIQTRIHQYSIADHLVYLIIGTILQAIALQFAYKNVKFVSREKIATLRSEAIANEVSNQVGKQINRQERVTPLLDFLQQRHLPDDVPVVLDRFLQELVPTDQLHHFNFDLGRICCRH